MSDTTPLRESAAGEPTAKLVEDASRLRPWSSRQREEVWQRIDSEVHGRPARAPMRWALLAPVAAACALAVWVVAGHRGGSVESGWAHVELGASTGSVELAAGSEYRLERSGTDVRRVFLTRGTVRAQIVHQRPGEHFVVETPDVRVVVVGTRFTVQAGEETTVEVEEGRVRVESAGGEVYVSAGERVSSKDPRLASSRTLVAEPANRRDDCGAEMTIAARRSCFESAAAGSGLAAQNALYALGLLARDDEHQGARAVEHWREYQRRFPEGAFAPEVGLAVAWELAAQNRDLEAFAAAGEFARRFPGDPRGAELALLRGRIACEKLHRLDVATKAFAEATAESSTREAALFARGRCERDLGQRAGAREALRQYLDEFPRGAHAAEAAALMRQLERQP